MYSRASRRRRLMLSGDSGAETVQDEAESEEVDFDPAPAGWEERDGAERPATLHRRSPSASRDAAPHDEPIELSLTPPGGEPEPLRIDTRLFFIGRGPRVDLRLPHAEVSGRHVVLRRFGSDVLFLDLESRVGTRLDGAACPVGWLTPGRTLGVGPYRLARPDHAAAAPPPVESLFARRTPPPASAGFHLRIVDSPGRTEGVADVCVNRPVTLVGRSHRCKLRLPDETVSRVHLMLTLEPDGLRADDLLSRGGLFVNGRAVPRGLLRAGDLLGVGRYRFELVRHAESAPHDADSTLTPDQAVAARLADRVRRHAGEAESLLDHLAQRLADAGAAEEIALLRRLERDRRAGWDRLLARLPEGK